MLASFNLQKLKASRGKKKGKLAFLALRVLVVQTIADAIGSGLYEAHSLGDC
jgi:hypothetical protein